MTSVYKTINGIQTHLLTWGDPFNANSSDVIVCITGNPGVPDFYKEFATEIFKNTKLPVCVIGHAGHEDVPHEQSNNLKKQEHLFDLEGQVAHKMDFITNLIHSKSKIHLIGHSIGAWLILEVLQKNSELINRVLTINLLFPTLQGMSETSNGKFLNNVLRRFHFIIIILLYLLYLFPKKLFMFMINVYLKCAFLPPDYNIRIWKFLNFNVVEKVLFLAYDEMDNVTKLNTAALNKVKHLCHIIYSVTDGWVPIQYIENIQTLHPELHVRELKCDHSFVLHSSEYVAQAVLQNIKSKKNIEYLID